MRKSLYFIFFQILCLELTHGWDNTFSFKECYEKKIEEKMPLSIDNLIAIIEGYEKDNSNTAPEDIADALLYRYQKNGIIYNPIEIFGGNWFAYQQSEINKQVLDDKLLKLSKIVPQDAIQNREECSVHMSLSHSIDFYKHPGVDYIWENNYFKRKKRSVVSSYTYRDLPENMDIAEHPIEFGVIQTNAGPVSGGLLLAGILSSATTASYTVKELLNTEYEDKFPSDIGSYKILPLFGTTISGILAKAAILTLRVEGDFEIGPIGRFGNCSSCPRLYSLEKSGVYHLTRAELFGALDGFIIGSYLQNQGISQSVTLSEILRMYYSDHGLYNPDLRACNRQNIFTKYQGDVSDTIRDQALYYMYVYQQYFPSIRTEIEVNYEKYPDKVQEKIQDYLNAVLTETNSFMSSYSYDDPGYYRCPTNVDSKYETQVDLTVVYSPIGSSSDVENQLEYIGLTARRVGVGYDRSRIAVLNGRNYEWISSMTNYTNIADYVCNYTTSVDYAVSSSQDFIKILDLLSKFYNDFYLKLKSDPDLTGRNSQVVLWNLPNKFDGDADVMLREWKTFNQTYPDVSFMFFGSNGDSILSFLGDLFHDVIVIKPTSSESPVEISTDILTQIMKAPRMFYFAACDNKNSEYSNYNEDDHVYSTYISPNFTTIIRIPPQNFHFSETLKLHMEESDFWVCLSRTNSQPSEYEKGLTYCQNSPLDYEVQYLCDRYLDQCHPIYISVRANSRSTRSSCSDDYCVYPNQIEFKMTHEGMVCSSCLLSPTLLLLFFITIFVIILGN